MRNFVFRFFLFAIFSIVFPVAMNAQNDGFFRGYDDGSRDGGGISNETFGQNNVPGPITTTDIVPLGGGLIIMMAAGAGYALVKRKRTNSMKKIFTIVSVLIVVFGLTQCKKKTDDFANIQNTAHIVLNVDGDAKVDVNTGSGEVKFTEGDVIHVGYNGDYVGTLTHNGKSFTGNLTITKAGDQKLYFYFLGNIEPTYNSTEKSLKVDIGNQKNSYPVISFGVSTENFNGSGSYSAMLKNKCALVKFTPNNIGGTIRMTGCKNIARFMLGDATAYSNGFGSWKSGDGIIDLHKVNNSECWAILLPGDAVTVAAKSFGYLRNSSISLPKIKANDYLTEGIPITLTPAPAKAFTTSGDDTYVYFAKGNLQCTKEDGTTWDDGYSWSFKTNQYDIDYNNGFIVGDNYKNVNVISHFGWGATGYNRPDEYAPLNYKPNSTANIKTAADVLNPYHYGPSWTAVPTVNPDAGVNKQILILIGGIIYHL